ncbi:MAG: FAD-dependent oxidoreductase [Phycisphaerales bacterium]|nr:FAD-dependent oxidoreductase [Phycisphaerales bacterium]
MFGSLPSLGQFDIVVVGSGSSGSPAAVSAARQGMRVLLLDRLPFLGGISTVVLDTFYGYYTPGTRSKRVVGGIADEVQRRLDDYGMQLERPSTFGAGTGVTYHPEYLKVVWEQMAAEAGVSVLLNAFVQAVEGAAGRRINSLVVATKAGLQRVEAGVFVDCSGDADLCAFGGFDYELAGQLEPAQMLTTSFKLVNVDLTRRKTITKQQLHELIAEAAASGQYDLPMKEGSDHITPVEHMTATVMTRLPSFRQQARRPGRQRRCVRSRAGGHRSCPLTNCESNCEKTERFWKRQLENRCHRLRVR